MFDKRGIETTWSDGARSTYKYDDRGFLIEPILETKGNEDLTDYKDKTIYKYE